MRACLTPTEYQFTDDYWTDNGQYQDHSGCKGACSPIPYGTSALQGSEVTDLTVL